MCLVHDRLFELTVTIEQFFNRHGAELVSLDQDYLGDSGRLLPILIRLDVLAELGHDSAQLQMELAEVAVSLELCAQLVVSVLGLGGNFSVISDHGTLCRRSTDTIVLVEVLHIVI